MSKKTVLLLHPAGFSSQFWAEITPLLSDHDILAPDMPGHGSNKHFPFTTIEAAADFFADRLRDHLEAGTKVHLAGLALGAYIGFALIERHPDLIDSAMLCGFQITGIEGAARFKRIASIVAPLLNINYFRRKNYQAIGLDERSKLIDWDGPAPAKTATVVKVLKESVDFARTQSVLEAIDIPILVIAAQHDQPANLTSLPALDKYLPQGVGYTLPAEAHFWPAKRPQLFVQILDQWMSQESLTDELVPVQAEADKST